MLQEHPDRVIREAVRRMLPKTKLGKAMLRKLKVYAGPSHPHQAQGPEKLEV
jgi:large subunit ribosomal protein L13